MTKTSIVITLASLLLALPAAAQDPPPPDRRAVELALSDHETLLSKERLLRLGPGVEGVLRQLVTSPSRRALARSRAIAALRFFPSKETRTALLGVIRTARKVIKPSVALIDLQEAAVSYAVVAGPASLATVSGLLRHANLDVRSSAAEAVRLSRHPRAEAVLLARVKRDPSATVRYRIQRELKLLRSGRRGAR